MSRNKGEIKILDSLTDDHIRVNELHKLIRKAKYFYYVGVEEGHQPIMSDYEFDMVEKEYEELCFRLGVPQEKMASEFVGFSIGIPMRLFYTNEDIMPL